MKSEVTLNLIMVNVVLLFLLSACASRTSSSATPTVPASHPEQEQSAATPDGNRMTSMNEQQEVRSQPIKLYPVDEGQQDGSFVEFRSKLLSSAREHDTTSILSILDPGIINSSDGERGVKAFKDQWRIDQPESKLWETLTTILLMGGSFRINEGNKEFCAPYISSQWRSVVSQLPKSVDPLDYQVITERNVAIRSEPNLTAPVVTNLSYDVVKVSEGSVFRTGQIDGATWLKVMTSDGKQGYVLDKYVRGASDYQACFRKVGTKWLMTELAARE